METPPQMPITHNKSTNNKTQDSNTQKRKQTPIRFSFEEDPFRTAWSLHSLFSLSHFSIDIHTPNALYRPSIETKKSKYYFRTSFVLRFPLPLDISRGR